MDNGSIFFFFFSSRRRHTRCSRDWSSDVCSSDLVALVREYWAYHHWANRKLFEVTATLGEEAAGRPVGTQFSEPTLRAMLAHIYGAEWFWLETWRGRPPAVVRGDPTYGLVIRTLGELRRRGDELEAEQRRVLDDLVVTDLARPLDGTTPEGRD